MFDYQWLHDPEFFWVSGVPDDHIAYCKLCKKEISVVRSGKSALRAHAKGKKHSELSLWIGCKTAVQPVNPTYVLSQNCYINNCSASTSTGKRCKTSQPKKMLCASSSAKNHLALAPQRKHVKITEKVIREQIRYGNKSSVSRFQRFRFWENSSSSDTRDKYLSFGEKEKMRKGKKKKKDCSLDDDGEEEEEEEEVSEESSESDDCY